MFTATFFGIQNLLVENRGVHDVFNIAGAGSATASAFGLICISLTIILSLIQPNFVKYSVFWSYKNI
jgi:hypothetical protein